MQAERRELVFGRAFYWALGFLGVGMLLYWLRDVLTPVFLAMTIVPAFLVFAQVMTMSQNKILMFIGTVGWFVTAPFWMKK